MIALLAGLSDLAESQSRTFPSSDGLAGTPAAIQAASFIARASSLSPGSLAISQAEARIALAVGDPNHAVRALEHAADTPSANPLIDEILLTSLIFSGQPEKALARYNAQESIQHTRNLSNTLALADLQLAQPLIEADALLDAVPYLEQAITFRSVDLYANWHLLIWSERTGNAPMAAISRQRLERFSIDAVAPIQRRLLPTTGQAVAALSDSGFWDRELTLRVARFLVWRAPEAESVHQLIESLAAQQPADSQWQALLGELMLRRDGLAGVPNRNLAQSGFIGLPTDFNPQTEIADLLAVPPDDFELGPNLLPQGDFDRIMGGTLEGWRVADYASGDGADSPAAAFGAGPDAFAAFAGAFSARIDGLWKGTDSQPGFFGLVTHDEARYGSYALSIAPQRSYALTGIYRTGGAKELGSIYLGHPVATLFDAWLPATDGGWRPFVFIGCHNQPAVQQMQLLLRSWGEGQIWFDDVRLQEIVPKVGTLKSPACP